MVDVNGPMADSGVTQFTTAQMPNMRATAGLVISRNPGPGPIVGCLQNGYYIPTATEPPGYYNPNAPQCGNGEMPAPAAAPSAATPSAPPTPPAPTLTPQGLLQRLPSIIQPAPAVKPPPACDSFSQWVADNQLALGIGMALAAIFVWRDKV